MAIITKRDFSKIRKNNPNKVIVYCDGSFDLPHAGHILFFEDCKGLGDVLIVGVGTDIGIRKRKGEGRPILNQDIRLKTIDSFKSVDYAFLNKLPHYRNMLSQLDDCFKKLRPDIYVVNEDAFDIGYREKISKKHGVKLAVLKRTCPIEFEAISTSKIIDKIKNI